MSDFVNILDPEYIAGFRERQKGRVTAVPTPFPHWNRVSGGDGGGEGLAKRWLVTLGGNPKRGKTLMALGMAETALRHGERVGFMSLEMSDPELASRFYAMVGRVGVKKLEKGKHFEDEALDDAVERITSLPWESGVPSLFVNVDPIFDLTLLLEHMHMLAEENGVRWFIVDYLQLVSLDDDDEAVRTVTRAVKELRRFAKVTDSLVVGVSQFKRSVSEDYTRSPMPQGLFGGGAIEQTSDQIAIIDHSLYEYDRERHVSRTWLKLTNRHGQHGDIPILWNYRDLTVREAMPDEESAWPTRDKKPGRKRSPR